MDNAISIIYPVFFPYLIILIGGYIQTVFRNIVFLIIREFAPFMLQSLWGILISLLLLVKCIRFLSEYRIIFNLIINLVMLIEERLGVVCKNIENLSSFGVFSEVLGQICQGISIDNDIRGILVIYLLLHY